MDTSHDGTHTRGMKGLPYDWQALLIPVEPVFTEELGALLDKSRDASLESELTADAGL